MAHISVVIPVYRAESCLEELYRRLRAALESVTEDFEIVLVEDCGGDRSWPMIVALAKRDPRVKGIQFSRNFGQHYGITAGLDHCDGDWVVVMDCDLQDRPEEIPRLYAKAEEGHEVVIASRGKRNDPPLKRILAWGYFKLFNLITDIDYDGQGNFRIISRAVVQNLRAMREQLRFFGGMIKWLGYSAEYVEVQHAPRFAGESSYDFARLWKLAIEILLANSDKPLRFTVRLGFLIASVAFVFGMYILFRGVIYGSPVLGWSSLIVSFYFLGGIIISILGILGVYVGKIFDQVKGRPLYVILRATNGKK